MLPFRTRVSATKSWNHIVGFGFLTIIGLAIGGLIPAGAFDAPGTPIWEAPSVLSSLPPEAG